VRPGSASAAATAGCSGSPEMPVSTRCGSRSRTPTASPARRSPLRSMSPTDPAWPRRCARQAQGATGVAAAPARGSSRWPDSPPWRAPSGALAGCGDEPCDNRLMTSNTALFSGINVVRIGFVGLGVMGAPMARNLASAGYHLCVFDADPARAQALAQERIEAASDLGELAACSDIVITMLPNGEVV